jgi:hypothetical protein
VVGVIVARSGVLKRVLRARHLIGTKRTNDRFEKVSNRCLTNVCLDKQIKGTLRPNNPFIEAQYTRSNDLRLIMSTQVRVVSGSLRVYGDISDQVKKKMMLQVARGYAFLSVLNRRRQVGRSKKVALKGVS